MCGFAGMWNPSAQTEADELEATATAMAGTLVHRGPDDAGTWIDPQAGVALAHRRLAIVDLSPEGHQPMVSACGRYVVAFNGEIYNFPALRRELERGGSRFRGHSDTEVLLAAVSEWELRPAVERFVGMFAFALWDRKERKLSLCRDRLGEKPLYYGWMNDVFLFGSELKALRVHPSWNGEVSSEGLTLFLRYNYVPAPHSIHVDVFKLLPGTILTLEAGARSSPSPVPYWSAADICARSLREHFHGTEREAAANLEELLRDVVRGQMIADVPLGAFLSGGVDSSTIVALMQAESSRSVRTFTIGFHEIGHNEAEHARAVAQHLGTDHTELYVTPREALEVIPRLPTLYDEPFADSSQIPTFLVSQLARQSVTVSLSGDGGDELFGGYNRYFLGRSVWNGVRWLPRFSRAWVSRLLDMLPPATFNGASAAMAAMMPPRWHQPLMADKVKKLSSILAAGNPEALYLSLVSSWHDPDAVVRQGREPWSLPTQNGSEAGFADFTEQMMYLDLVTYLPDDILVKVDRASMGVSLESRAPFLDHRVVEFVWGLPLSMKIRRGAGKRLLRQVLYRHVPRELIERPKMGFAMPVAAWLRGPLRDWAEHLLDQRRLRDEGYFDPAPIGVKWREHVLGTRDWQHPLWGVLMFQCWLESVRTSPMALPVGAV
jgi:asparagine synthase (glutamine-hydrolysing)